ncbi:hypothetical protein KM043_003684 [Ampulex compressa]|nr:hypothetical protein KM043_003684 [Ampulex compressa]
MSPPDSPAGLTIRNEKLLATSIRFDNDFPPLYQGRDNATSMELPDDKEIPPRCCKAESPVIFNRNLRKSLDVFEPRFLRLSKGILYNYASMGCFAKTSSRNPANIHPQVGKAEELRGAVGEEFFRVYEKLLELDEI